MSFTHPLARLVQNHYGLAEKGHDFAHLLRVWVLAREIGAAENANLELLELGCLLHDAADHKFNPGTSLRQLALPWLREAAVPEEMWKDVLLLAENCSWSRPGGQAPTDWTELRCLRDADRLEAMGALGISRCFHYGGFRNRDLFVPDLLPDPENGTPASLNHFFEKLLLLRDGMYTVTGRRMAEERHRVLWEFCNTFLSEWFYPEPIPAAWQVLLDRHK